MDWQTIDSAPLDGSIVETGVPVGYIDFQIIPYPLPARFIEGRWRAEFGRDDWQSFSPQPQYWRPLPSERSERS